MKVSIEGFQRERTGTANASLAPSFDATSPYIATLFLYFWKNSLAYWELELNNKAMRKVIGRG